MTKKYRYPGTEPFSTEDKDLFFGRDEDIQKLYQAILLEQITVLHGKSGYGKTSLLRAGILPRLGRENNLQTFYVRPGRFNREEGAGLIDNFLQKAFPKGLPASSLLEKIADQGASLWYYFKSLQIENPDLSGFVIILDQFEECFTYTPFQLDAFKKELSDLLYVKLPQACRERLKKKLKENPDQYTEEVLSLFYAPINVKVVFSIRSDKLSQMDQLKDYFPNILQNNYVLDALKRRQASLAITAPAQLEGPYLSPRFGYTQRALDQILNFLSSRVTQSVEAFQLQMVCQYIEMYLIGPEKTLVEESDLEHLEEVVENFYDKQIERLGDDESQELARTMMEKLIFEDDLQRISMYDKQIFKELNITPELLNKMVACRLVRAEVSPSTGATMYEITHDTLVQAVIKSKKRRQQATLLDKMAEKSKLQQQVNALERKWKEELDQLDSRIEQHQKSVFIQEEDFLKEPPSLPLDRHLSYLYYQRGYLSANMKWYDKALEDYGRAILLDPQAAYLYNSRGIVYYDSGRHREAIEQYVKAIELDPTQAYYYTNAGLAYERLQAYDEAEQFYNKALEVDDTYAEAYNSRGNIHYNRQEYQEAEADYLRALDLEPDNPIYLRNLGSNLNKLGRPEKAMHYFEKSIRSDPGFADAYNSRGNLFFNEGRYEEAMADYRRAIELKNDEAVFHRNLGLCYEKTGSIDKAMTAYSNAIERNPTYADAYNSLGNVYYDQKQYEEAIHHFQKAIELNGKKAMFYRNLGLAYERIGDVEQAIAAYDGAIEIKPAYSDAYNSRGNIFYDRQDYEAAVINYQKAIEYDDEEPVFYRNLGLSYDKAGKKEAALQSYDRAIELDSAYSDAYNSRGNILYGLERYEEAIEDYQKAIELNKTEPIFHRNLGLSFEKAGKKDQALQSYGQAIQLSPAYADAYNSRGNLFFNDGAYEKAISDYQRAIESQPDNAIFYRNLGTTYEALGKTEAALGSFDKAIELDPEYLDAYNSRGIFYHNQGQYEPAIKDLEKALSINNQEKMIWRNLGVSYQFFEQFEKALECFEKAIEIDPLYPDPYNDIANIYYNHHKDFEKALSFYQKAVALEPEEQIFLVNLASNYVMLGQYEAGMEVFNKALALRPHDPTLYIHRGGTYQDFLQNTEKALADYEKAISLDPNEEQLGEIYRNMVELYAGQKNVEKAEHYLELSEPLKEPDSFYHFLRAKIALSRGEEDLFFEELQKSLDTKPAHQFYVYLDKDKLLKPYLENKKFKDMVEAFKQSA
jgi:tetratricopeptide (TPR) repeat protein